MPDRPHALEVPPGLDGDPNAHELARIWAAHGKQLVRLNLNLGMDPAGYGLLLVDLARHIARAYAQSGRYSEAAALRRILDGVNMELTRPTDRGSGTLT